MATPALERVPKAAAVPLDENPAAVYLARLGTSSRRPMGQGFAWSRGCYGTGRPRRATCSPSPGRSSANSTSRPCA